MPMSKHLATLVIAAGSLVLCASGSVACAATPSPMWPGQSSTGSKTDCSSDASGNSKKDCDKISPDRLSTKEKASMKTSQSQTTYSHKSASAATSGSKQAATSSSGTKAATASSSDTKKDADKK